MAERITSKTVRELAALMKLSVSTEEETSLAAAMEDLLRLAEEMQSLDLADVPPTAHIAPLKNVLRPDEITPSLPRETMLMNAPARTETCIAVPKTIEGGA